MPQTGAFAQPIISAAESTLVHLAPADAAKFQTGLTSLSEQARVAIVTEGVPVEPRLSRKVAPDLTAGLPISSAIAKFASAYDYDTQRVNGVFVLTKRYTYPQDLPCITLAECREAAKNITSLLDSFNPQFAESIYANGPDGEKDGIVQFFEMLSPSQLAAAQARTLRYGDLSAEQQAIVRNLFLFPLIQQPADRIADAGSYFDTVDKGTVTLLDDQGYSGLFLALPKSGASTDFTYLSLIGGGTRPGQQNPMIGSQATVAPDDLETRPPATLGSVVATLGPIAGQKPVAAPSVSGKPIVALGLKYASPKDVMLALASLYGLRNGASHTASLPLEPSYVAAPIDLKQLNFTLWTAVPASYVRALHIQLGNGEISYLNLDTDSAPTSLNSTAQVEDYARFQSLQGAINSQAIPGAMQPEAKRCLLAAMQQQIKKSGWKARISVSLLDDNARRALAVLLMTNLVSTLQNSFNGPAKQSVMNCLDNMDQTIIYTDLNAVAHVHGQDVPSFNLVGTDPYTNKQIGLGGIQYVSHD